MEVEKIKKGMVIRWARLRLGQPCEVMEIKKNEHWGYAVSLKYKDGEIGHHMVSKDLIEEMYFDVIETLKKRKEKLNDT